MIDCLKLASGFLSIGGLCLDLIGFALVIRYGHALFIRIGPDPPGKSEAKDGDLYIGGVNDPGYSRRLGFAKVGVGLVIAGFLVQIAGAALGLWRI